VNPSPVRLPPLVERLVSELPADLSIALVGGAVRDILLDHPIHDYDFIVPSGAMRTARLFADRIGAAYFPLDEQRDYARLVWQEGERIRFDFAAYQGSDIYADLWGRDFTINAIAIDLRQPDRLIDPTGGASDLLARQIRPCRPDSLSNDPVRVLRGVRLANALEARLPPETLALMRSVVPGLASISPERLRDELFRILDLRQVATAVRILDTLGALPYVLPELPALKGVQQSAPHIYDVWEHTLDALNRMQTIVDVLSPTYDAEQAGSLIIGLLVMRLGRYRTQLAEHLAAPLNPDRPLRALLTLAVLYHDTGKPQTRSVDADGRIRFFDHDKLSAALVVKRGQALRLSNLEIERLETIVRHHMRPSLLAQAGGTPSRKAVYHYFRDTGVAGIDICLLSLADKLATYGPTLTQEKWSALLDVERTLMENWWERPQEAITPARLVNGYDLMQAHGLSPGPRLGEILEAIREAQVDGQVTTRAEALEFVNRFLTS
jgi:tRNA nucleotidyltransferase/poly(A) polymerase